jgi:DNA-binding CsgD family transcriptional regulator
MRSVERAIVSLLGEASELGTPAELPEIVRRHLRAVLPSDEIYFAPFGPRFFDESPRFYCEYAERLPDFEADLARGRAVADRIGGFVDVEVYSNRERETLPAFAELVRPARISSMIFAAVHSGGVGSGIVFLLRKGQGRRFSQEQLLAAMPLLHAVGFVHRSFIPPSAERFSRASRRPSRADEALRRLSEAEREVAAVAAEGFQSLQIAATLGKSVHTVRRQLESMYRRLGVGNRTELAALIHRATARRDGGAGRSDDTERVLSDMGVVLARLPKFLKSGLLS